LKEALAEAEAAVALAPDSVTTQFALATVDGADRAGEARPVYQRALELAKRSRPRIPVELAPTLETKLASNSKPTTHPRPRTLALMTRDSAPRDVSG